MPQRMAMDGEQKAQQHSGKDEPQLGQLKHTYHYGIANLIWGVVFVLILVALFSFAFFGIWHATDWSDLSSDAWLTYTMISFYALILLALPVTALVFTIYNLRNLKRRIYIYEHALVEKKANGSQVIILWNEINYLWHNISVSSSDTKNRSKSSYSHSYTIQGAARKKNAKRPEIRFSPDFVHSADLFNEITQQTMPHLFSQALERYHAGQKVYFGKLAVSTAGIEIHESNDLLLWHELQSIHVDTLGKMVIREKGRSRNWFEDQIPNVKVFQNLITEVRTQSTHRVLIQQKDAGNAASTDANVFSPGDRLAWRYEIVETRGQGGFGLVYKALDQQRSNLPVAIKQINLAHLRPQEIIEATDSYNREILHLSKLRHENLPRIYDHFTDQQHWYIVMEYIHGTTLEDTIASGNPLPEDEVIEIGITLCSVLSYLHAQNPPVIFRDVKPANIMRTSTRHLYLIDFGIARHYVESKGRDTRPLGSPGYAAPEQYGKAQTTIQTDIYGLGATLQHLLMGKDLHDMLALTNDEHLPARLRPLLKQMLASDSPQRPHDMDEVKTRLIHIRDGGL